MLFIDATEQCGKRLTDQGVDLNQYGLSDAADDVPDLIIAKGWRQLNIQGNGERSRIAVLVATRYPGVVRSIAISDPLPRDATQNTQITNFNASLKAYYAACQAQLACARAFPGLEELLPRLAANTGSILCYSQLPIQAGAPI